MTEDGKKQNDGDESFQFADDVENQTWFRRAVKSGVKYVKQYSERSGLKFLPELNLETSESIKAQLDESGLRGSQSSRAPKGLADKPSEPPPPPPPPRKAGGGGMKPKEQPSQFKDGLIGNTAIHSFLKSEAAKPARQLRKPGASPIYYAAQPQESSRWVKFVCLAVGIGLLLGLGYFIEARYQMSALFLKLHENNRRAAPTKSVRPTTRD